MKMRPPAFPLINVDPYFSVWSMTNELNGSMPNHWTESPNSMIGTVIIDGEDYNFMGQLHHTKQNIKQICYDCTAMSTKYVFANEKIELTAIFTSPLLVEDLYYASRPVTYLKVFYNNLDGVEHKISVKIAASEELVLNRRGEGRVLSDAVKLKNGNAIKMGNGVQNILSRSGDDLRIDWGYFYVGVRGSAAVGAEVWDGLYAVYVQTELTNGEALFTFAYDDIYSLIYFEKPTKAYWRKNGKTILEAIEEAIDEYETLYARCEAFSDKLYEEAVAIGGENYAELLLLSYRQIMAGHKLAVDEDGNNIYVSKECFSNGCAATVDVTYPSAPLFLLYNTELLKGMLRPIFQYAATIKWKYDFAPHDVGQYPILNGQVYGGNEISLSDQMPVEECGNMIILMAAICEADGNADFANQYIDVLSSWNKYLLQYGEDPAYQLCTDDFAGRLAHNCNLAVKAIMGIAGYAKILQKLGQKDSEEFMIKANELANKWCKNAKNKDRSYRLAFDKPETFSLKYNSVWDKIWKTKLFPDEMFMGEIARYKKEIALWRSA